MTTLTPATLQALSTARTQCLHKMNALTEEQTALRDSRKAAVAEFKLTRENRYAMEGRIDGIRNTASSVQASMRSAKTALVQGMQELQALDLSGRYIGKRDDGVAYRLKHGQLRPLRSGSALKNLLGIGQATRERQRLALEQQAGGCNGRAVSAWLSTRRGALESRIEGLQKELTLEPYFDRLVPQLVRAIGIEKACSYVAGMQQSGKLEAGLAELAASVEREGTEPLMLREVELSKRMSDVEPERRLDAAITQARSHGIMLHRAQLQARDELTAMELHLIDRMKTCEAILEETSDVLRVYKARLSTDSGQGLDEADVQEQLDQINACKAETSLQRQTSDEHAVLTVQLLQVREMLGLLPPV